MSQATDWEQYKASQTAGGSPIVERCISAIENLPGVTSPSPYSMTTAEGKQLMPDWFLFWGLPLTYLSDEPSFDNMRAKMGESIAANHSPDPYLMSEFNGAALVKALGADRVVRVAESSCTTPDFRVWWGAELIELEVTRADPKPDRYRLIAEQQFFTEEVAKLSMPWDLIFQVVHPWPRELTLRVLQHVQQLKPGELVEEIGKWRLRAEKVNRLCNVNVCVPSTDELPPWWPEKSARIFGLRGQVGGGPVPAVQPQVRVQFTIPLTSYVNPVAKKVEHFQGSDRAPFLIAIDVTALPHGFETLREELPEWFVTWKRMSGVLAIHGPAHLGVNIGWMWGLIPNPDPNYPLPKAMLESVPALAHLKDLSFALRASGGPVVIGPFTMTPVR
jgi:hypothetical protein